VVLDFQLGLNCCLLQRAGKQYVLFPEEIQDESPWDSEDKCLAEAPVSMASGVLEGGSGSCRLVDDTSWVQVSATFKPWLVS